jgi:hypothetical protein
MDHGENSVSSEIRPSEGMRWRELYVLIPLRPNVDDVLDDIALVDKVNRRGAERFLKEEGQYGGDMVNPHLGCVREKWCSHESSHYFSPR